MVRIIAWIGAGARFLLIWVRCTLFGAPRLVLGSPERSAPPVIPAKAFVIPAKAGMTK
jgi:hypothetical protein